MAAVEKRFLAAEQIGGDFVIADCGTTEAFNKMTSEQRTKTIILRITPGGMISKMLADTWTKQMCDQLNQFDIANAAVAKLT